MSKQVTVNGTKYNNPIYITTPEQIKKWRKDIYTHWFETKIAEDKKNRKEREYQIKRYGGYWRRKWDSN